MKANELMIKDVMCGDWIDVRNDAAPNKSHYEQITPEHLLRDEHWYGIKLTPEILEKNGFHKEFDEDLLMYIHHRPLIELELGNRYKRYEDGGFYIKEVYHKFHFVHELQNILRMLGIEKEIII
jgi:hypothetical protein